MVPCTWKERDDSTSKEKNTNILRKPLVALHKSSSDVNQWQLIHEASGPSFQELTIKHDPNNKDALFSLHESLEATARCLDILKQRGRIPDMVRRLEVNIARNIETITKHIRALKLAFELDPIRYSDKICQDSQKLEESVEELQSLLDPTASSNREFEYIDDSGTIMTSCGSYHSNNKFSGPAGSRLRTILSRNATINLPPTTPVYSGNTYTVTENSPPEPKTEAVVSNLNIFSLGKAAW
jgi:hypothetical protein